MFKKVPVEFFVYTFVGFIFLFEFVWLAGINMDIITNQIIPDFLNLFHHWSVPLATFFGVWLAARTVRDWRKEHAGKHRYQIAQEAANIILKLTGVLGSVRIVNVRRFTNETGVFNTLSAAKGLLESLEEHRDLKERFADIKRRFDFNFRNHGKSFFNDLHELDLELHFRAAEIVNYGEVINRQNLTPQSGVLFKMHPSTLTKERFDENVAVLFYIKEPDAFNKRLTQIAHEAIGFLDEVCNFK